MNGAAAQVRASSTLRAFAGVAKNGTARKCVSRKPTPGVCWCGQKWDGEKMCFPQADAAPGDAENGQAAQDAQANKSSAP